MPPVSGSELRHPSEVKFDLASERLDATKSKNEGSATKRKNEDSVSKVASASIFFFFAVGTDLPIKKEVFGRVVWSCGQL